MYVAIYGYACIQSSPVHKTNSHPQERSRFPQVHLHLHLRMQMDLRCHCCYHFRLQSQLVASEMAGRASVNQHACMM